MSKEASMTFRVESQLRKQFNAAAEAEHRPAAQILRDFMRSYVEHVHGKAVSAHRIDPIESERRRADFDAAVGSVGLEGFSVPASYKTEAERFMRGEIEFSELTESMLFIARSR